MKLGVFLYYKYLITWAKVRDKIRAEVPHLWCLSNVVKDAACYLHGGINLNPGATLVPSCQQPQGNQLMRMVGDSYMAQQDF